MEYNFYWIVAAVFLALAILLAGLIFYSAWSKITVPPPASDGSPYTLGSCPYGWSEKHSAEGDNGAVVQYCVAPLQVSSIKLADNDAKGQITFTYKQPSSSTQSDPKNAYKIGRNTECGKSCTFGTCNNSNRNQSTCCKSTFSKSDLDTIGMKQVSYNKTDGRIDPQIASYRPLSTNECINNNPNYTSIGFNKNIDLSDCDKLKMADKLGIHWPGLNCPEITGRAYT